MSDIYDLHRKAFNQVAAFVIAHNGERVATVAFKYPRDGAGRLYCYVHWFGLSMARGYASGGGYDKASAAASAAMHKTKTPEIGEHTQGGRDAFYSFRAELLKDDGRYWYDRLRNSGFDVWQAV